MLSVLTTSIPSPAFCSSLSQNSCVRPQRWEGFCFSIPHFPLPKEKTLLSVWAFPQKGLFSNSWPSLAVPPFFYGWIIRCQLSSAAIPAPVQHCNVQRDARWRKEKCRKREKSNYRILKIADPLQLLMLREDFFFMWEFWAIFTKLLGCLVIRQKFNCNNMFSGFLPKYGEVWRWSHKVWHLWSNLSCYWQEFSPWAWYTSLWR